SWPRGFGEQGVSQGVAGLTMWTSDIPAPASKQFVDKYRARFGQAPVSYWAPLAYTNLVTAVQAAQRAGGADTARWIAAMERTSFEPPPGQTLPLKPSQTIKHQGFTSLVSFQWQKGKQEIIFPQNLSTARLEYPMP